MCSSPRTCHRATPACGRGHGLLSQLRRGATLAGMDVVGRQAEAARVADFLDGGIGAFVLDGDAGIGKTTVWLAGVEAARERGVRTLVARATETETQLPYATLADLLDPVADDALRRLPLPQRRALEVALVRREAETTWDARAVAAGTLTALRELAVGEAMLLAI